jgi:hypothetical protein
MKLSQAQKVVEFLKSNAQQRFTARQVAEAIVAAYPEDYAQKRQNDRFADERAFINQVVAEIGAQKEQIVKTDPHIFWQDKPRPRLFWYNPDQIMQETALAGDTKEEGDEEEMEIASAHTRSLSEHELYPILIEYLRSELRLYCQRIDERRSKNSRGNGGNQWLHPDIVAMQPIDKEWNDLVRACVKQGSGQSVRLWSFEVKKELSSASARKSYFQAVSNSSWANEGYLVATAITDSATEKELRMLSALHGIGVILLNPENPSESEMMLPARARSEVDWESVNRIVLENEDFRDYIELVSTYYQTGRVRSRDWNRIHPPITH